MNSRTRVTQALRVAAVLGLLATSLPLAAALLPQLTVSDNHRFLVTADGQPFFWLGDTAWELFHRLNREEATRYLEDRAAKGITIIQAVALAELDGLNTPNAYGHRPLVDNDPTRPDVKDGPDNDYWDHVDFIVRRSNELGLRIGFLPTWGDKWHKKGGKGPLVFNPDNAGTYGTWLGRRYRDAGLVWILGGEKFIGDDEERRTLEAMARGLKEGDRGRHLITFHPIGQYSSATWFHDAPCIWEHDGKSEIVTEAGDVVQGFDLKTGERIWSSVVTGEGKVPSAVLGEGVVFTSGGWGGKETIKAFKLGGRGDLKESNLVWEQKKGMPKVPSMLYAKPHLFAITDGGVAICLKAGTGEIVWQERVGGNFSASPVAAEGRIYFAGDSGETTVIEAGPEFKVLAKNPLGEKVQASPAISQGQVFIRTDKNLFCIGAK